jgi:hypothetical protein
MQSYTVTIVNEHFSQTGEHQARDDIAAWKSAIAGAIDIAKDQVSHGSPFFGAEVTITRGNEQNRSLHGLRRLCAAEGPSLRPVR